MSAFVLDCSITMTWCFEDEASPATDAILHRLTVDAAIVPALWRWEVANVLHFAVRRSRLTQADAAAKLSRLAALPISVDAEAQERAWGGARQLAQAENLTVYDAAYLELALRNGVVLATRDAGLIRAAANVGLPVIP